MTVRSSRRFRSTKGASKARRDHINEEIRNMRALLPISDEEQERLSYLHSMSLICTFIRKSVLLTSGEGKSDEGFLAPYEELIHALPGFIVAMTEEGKLIYVSENVSQYLGFSMVDVLQSDTFYDMVDHYDVDTVKFNLEEGNTTTERSFVCRMHTSKPFRLQYGSCCPLLVRGRFLDGPQCRLFVALCRPTVDRLKDRESHSLSAHFQSLHKADMSYTHINDSVVFHLGYKVDEMVGRSWYSMLHPDDLSVSANGHKHLMHQSGDGQVEMVLRLQAKDLSWVWLYVCAVKDPQSQEITCSNYVISETEAIYMRQKLSSCAPSPLPLTPPISQMPWGPGPSTSPKRQAEGSVENAGPRKKARRLSEPPASYSTLASPSQDEGDSVADMSEQHVFFSSPPYSPTSSISEDCGSDVLQDAYGHADIIASPSFSSSPSPSSLSFQHLNPQSFSQSSFDMELQSLPLPSYGYPECQSEVVPNYQPEASEGSYDFSLIPLLAAEGDAFQAPVESESSSSPHELPTSDPSLSIHSSTLSTEHYSESEQAEISVLAHQLSSLASSFDMYRVKSHTPQVTRSPCWPATASQTTELLLDGDVIDSILKNWDGAPVKKESGSEWAQLPRSLLEDQARLQDLSMVDSAPAELHSVEHHPWPCICRQACPEDNNELHQLSLYLHSNFQQDGFADESMY